MLPNATLSEQNIGYGWRGTAQTIEAMRRMVSNGKRNYALHEAVAKLVRTCPHKDRKCWALRIFGFIRDRIAYVNDPVGLESVSDPLRTIERGAGDCDDQAVLFNCLAEIAGMRTHFKTIKANRRQPDEFSHVYSVVEIPNVGSFAADCTRRQESFGWEPMGYPAQVWPGSMET